MAKTIQVLYFAAIREMIGSSSEEIQVEGDTVADAFDVLTDRHERLVPVKRHLRFALNQNFVQEQATIEDGDVLAIIPPVAGGAPQRFKVCDSPIYLEDVIRIVERPEAGAIASFEGVVRNHTGDRQVSRLEYEAYHSMAEQELERTAASALESWPRVEIAIHHRVGTLNIGDRAVVIAVSSPHRKDAFAACAYVIDRLKENVPIWKKEVGPNGEEWVGFGP